MELNIDTKAPLDKDLLLKMLTKFDYQVNNFALFVIVCLEGSLEDRESASSIHRR